MKIEVPDLDFRTEPREMDGNEIDLVSTSFNTANASSIILNSTDMVRTKFVPIVVDNPNSPEKCVSGELVHERKSKKDSEFPTEKITKRSVKVGEHMGIRLDTSETYTLFEGLRTLYQLKSDIGITPLGSATYTKIDSSFRQFHTLIQSDPSAARLLANEENYDLVKLLLKLITQTDSIDSLRNSLEGLDEANISALSNAVSIEKLERVLSILEGNLDNGIEEEWQKIFSDHQWVLSQIFPCPCTILNEKAYVGGKGLSNRGGNLADFIYRNSITQNVALIEIKTPLTPLLGGGYRGTYSLSSELSGAINQVLNYKDSLSKEFYAIRGHSQDEFEAFNPKCCIIIGKAETLNSSQLSTLENYRNILMNVNVITFDELVQKVRDMLSLFRGESGEPECDLPEGFDNDGELPF